MDPEHGNKGVDRQECCEIQPEWSARLARLAFDRNRKQVACDRDDHKKIEREEGDGATVVVEDVVELSLAEREGVPLEALEMTPESITLTLGLGRLAAVGFLAELRRNTNAWYEGKYAQG